MYLIFYTEDRQLAVLKWIKSTFLTSLELSSHLRKVPRRRPREMQVDFLVFLICVLDGSGRIHFCSALID